MRLIDADALIDEIKYITGQDTIMWFDDRKIKREQKVNMAAFIERMPTISPEQAADLSEYSDRLWKIAYERGKGEAVKHGEWIYKGARGRFPICECSVCGNAENADWAVLGDNVNYCPHCGARMDGGEDDG